MASYDQDYLERSVQNHLYQQAPALKIPSSNKYTDCGRVRRFCSTENKSLIELGTRKANAKRSTWKDCWRMGRQMKMPLE